MAVGGSYGYTRTGRRQVKTYRPWGYGSPPPASTQYPGGVPPHLSGPARPGAPWARVGGPWVRVGGRPAPGTSGAPTAGPAGPGGAYAGIPGFNPPPLPAGTYSPEHDILSRESQTKLGYTQADTETGEQRGEDDYWTALARLQEGSRNETADYSRAKDELGRAYRNLAGRQSEQQAGAGVLEGGAALQAAQKRAANQGREQGESDIRHTRAQQSFADRIGDLTTGQERSRQDFEKGLKRSREDDLSYRKGQYELGAYEASQRGYTPGKPAARAVPTKSRVPPKKKGRR